MLDMFTKMNIPGSTGHSTCKRQENGDQTMDSERPLKKARFAWQVKGKYHLKNETSECSKVSPIISEAQERPGTSKSAANDLAGNAEQNLEILGDYLLKQDFNTLDSVITDTDKTLVPSSSSSNDKLEYPRYVGPYGKKSMNGIRKSSSENGYSALPMSMVVSHGYSEDQCIARWQARQMAKGFVDNTINRVLDSWLVTPLPNELENNQFLALDVAEFINNLPGDNTIENEGILMAISAHGLQNTSSSSSCDLDDLKQCSSGSKSEKYISRQNSPALSDEEQCNEDFGSNSLDMSWPYTEEAMSKNVSDLNHLSLFPDTNTQYKYFDEAENIQTSNVQYDNVETSSSAVDNHLDFLDAAVSFAIQNKGLTSFGNDYG